MRLASELARYLKWLADQKSYSPETVRENRYRVGSFLRFAELQGVGEPREITREVLTEWAEDLAWRTGPKGDPLCIQTRVSYLCYLRGFLRYLFRNDATLTDLSCHVTLPKAPKKLPGLVLEHGEVERMIERATGPDPLALRDRAILEVLYSSALRASELAHLRLEEVNWEQGLIFVREGKGKKDRVVPLGSRAAEAIRAYVLWGRRELLTGPDPGTILLNTLGRPMKRPTILGVVKRTAREAGLQKKPTTHAFRRTCATLLLRDGANIRAVQEILGHSHLDTTAVYLKISAQEIKREHEKHHPREKKPEGPRGNEKVVSGPVALISTPAKELPPGRVVEEPEHTRPPVRGGKLDGPGRQGPKRRRKGKKRHAGPRKKRQAEARSSGLLPPSPPLQGRGKGRVEKQRRRRRRGSRPRGAR